MYVVYVCIYNIYIYIYIYVYTHNNYMDPPRGSRRAPARGRSQRSDVSQRGDQSQARNLRHRICYIYIYIYVYIYMCVHTYIDIT